jgi:tRNA(His) 5'-end guanylyltransferase
MNYEKMGDWCKFLEKNFTPEIMIPTLPVIIRLDGNNFHNWTKGLNRPFEENLTDLMIDTTKFLVKETNAVIGYTQSDEITLILYSSDRASSIYHDGKKQKILSKLTAKCTQYFNDKRKEYLPNHNKNAIFDCRIYQVPSLHDACVQLLWRENDAIKNSIYMLAYTMYSENELFKINSTQLKDKMLVEKNVDWNKLPSKFRKGSYVRRINTSRPFTKEELLSLPPKHKAHSNPNLVIQRSIIEQVEFFDLNIVTNLVDVIFNNKVEVIKLNQNK